MNIAEKKFIEILKSYVKDEKIDVRLENQDVWEKIIEESKEHCVDGIVYSTIDWNNSTPMDEKIKNEWKNRIFSQGIWQINHIKKTCDLFKEFNKEQIEFVVLKGFIIRDFYKRPEQRIMGDIDILVREENLDKISDCLENLGYEKGNKAGHHIDFVNNKTFHRIEVHWNLVNRNYFKQEVPLENTLWENVSEVNINKAKTLKMSIEDMLIHLCLHMAVHIAYGGFGVRHLLDIAIISKSMEKEINWKKVSEISKQNNIEKFTYLVFLACNSLFETKIPREIQENFNISKSELDVFLEEILKSGVHGKREENGLLISHIAFDLEEDSINNNVFKRYLKLFFPSVNQIGDKYSYAKKIKILLPIAWIHRIFNGIISDEFKNKKSFLMANFIKAHKKNKLLKWLEL